MGGTHGKPITALEKRQKRLLESEKKKKEVRVQKEERSEKITYVTSELISKAEKELANVKYITPYMLMSKLNVTYGVAKDILEELYRKGKVTLISRSRRTAIYVPIDIAKKIEVPISPF